MKVSKFLSRSMGAFSLMFVIATSTICSAEEGANAVPAPSGSIIIADSMAQAEVGGFASSPLRQILEPVEVDGRLVLPITENQRTVPVLPNFNGELAGTKEGTIIVWAQITEDFFKNPEFDNVTRAVFSLGWYGPGSFACHVINESGAATLSFHGNATMEQGVGVRLGLTAAPITPGAVHQFVLTWKEGQPLVAYLDGSVIAESRTALEVNPEAVVGDALGFGARVKATPNQAGVSTNLVFAGMNFLRGEVYSTALSESQIRQRWEAVAR